MNRRLFAPQIDRILSGPLSADLLFPDAAPRARSLDDFATSLGGRATSFGFVGRSLPRAVAVCALAILVAGTWSAAQVITIDTGGGKGSTTSAGPVDRQFRQVTPTHVDLPKTEMDPKTRILLERDLQAEQGFANRPFPRGHKGLTLEANGKLEPADASYQNLVVNAGLSAKPGSRVVVTNIKIDKSRIILDFDGGPDAKHRFLRHLQIGMGPQMGDPDADPELINQEGDPAGSRVTLVFANYVPMVTAAQVKELLAPLISFDVKTPIQAYTDTLPTALKDAILDHKALVGMNTEMLMFAKGQPTTKSREMDGQMPFEEWVYGTPPEEVDFVRINGNRVIRVEIAKDGQPLAIFTADVVSPMLISAGTPELAQAKTRTIKEGDVETDPNKEEAPAPPSLLNPGEARPTNNGAGEMRPVQFPKPHTDDAPGANPDEQSSAPPAGAPAAGQPAQSQPASGTQPVPASTAPVNATPADGKQQPPAGSNQLVETGAADAVTN
jgi:hypothetical protein